MNSEQKNECIFSQALGIMMLTFSVMAYIDGGVLSDLISMADTDTEAGDIVISVFSTASILIMVISCLVVIVSFFGCCGAIEVSNFTVLFSFSRNKKC